MIKRPKILISTVPFGTINSFPLEQLDQANFEYKINPLGRKLTENDLLELIPDYDGLIAGTEEITENVIKKAKNLKIISRVGVGLDSVNLNAAKENKIVVTFTPDAPGPAVAELTIGLIIGLLRKVHLSNIMMHKGKWNRFFGKRIAECTIGIIGAGKIGTRVLRRIAAFGTPKIYVNDIHPNLELNREFKLEWVEKNKIFTEADVISIHVPLTQITYNMINKNQINLMKENSIIINTSRGGIVNEKDLFQALKSSKIGGAAIDVFEKEPYTGELKDVDNCLLTAHMGSMSEDCRSRMEIESTAEIINFFTGKELKGIVPKEEYINQRIFS